VTEVELVAAALAEGASARLTDTARGAVRELYIALRETVRRRLAGDNGYGVRVLDAHEVDPEVWGSRLVPVLTAAGVAQDKDILAAARMLLGAERSARRLTLDARRVSGVSGGQ
jgi:hypothetical protein